jgi:hypothetical protein
MERYKIEFIPNRGMGVDQQKMWKLLAYGSPIKPASEFVPDWWKKLGKTYTKNPINYGEEEIAPTAKSCPGIFDFSRAGYILPMWADMYFKWHEGDLDGWDMFTTEIVNKLDNAITMHNYEQVSGAPFLENNCQAMVKINSPWYMQVPKGVSLFLTQPFYHNNNDFTVCPGIIDPEVDRISNKELNCFIKLNTPDKIIKLKRGQPLMQIIPFVRAEYEFENNVPDDLDDYQIDILNIVHRAVIEDNDDPIKKLAVNRIPKKYNV